eukprot:5020115-Amphidinium_carterae.1
MLLCHIGIVRRCHSLSLVGCVEIQKRDVPERSPPPCGGGCEAGDNHRLTFPLRERVLAFSEWPLKSDGIPLSPQRFALHVSDIQCHIVTITGNITSISNEAKTKTLPLATTSQQNNNRRSNTTIKLPKLGLILQNYTA